MYAIEFRDDEYDELIEEAKSIVHDAHKMKKKACKLIKKLAYSKEDEDYDGEDYEEEEDEMMEEVSYRGQGGSTGASYRRRGGSGSRVTYRRMR